MTNNENAPAPREQGVRLKVIRFFQENPNQDIYIREVAEATGLRIDQASTAASRLIRVPPPLRTWGGLEHVTTGVFRYAPPDARTRKPRPEPPATRPVKSGRLFEEIASGPNGGILAKDENNVLYVVKELDL